jgi:hypothetical protein
VYGDEPPIGVAVAVPSFPPLHVEGVEVTVAFTFDACVIVTEAVAFVPH